MASADSNRAPGILKTVEFEQHVARGRAAGHTVVQLTTLA